MDVKDDIFSNIPHFLKEIKQQESLNSVRAKAAARSLQPPTAAPTGDSPSGSLYTAAATQSCPVSNTAWNSISTITSANPSQQQQQSQVVTHTAPPMVTSGPSLAAFSQP